MSEDGALFDVPELAADPASLGRVEASLQAALRAGQDAGTVVPEDAGLAAAALAAARALDAVDRHVTAKSAYAVAALLTPYRECLHALRLPAAIAPAAPALPATADPADDRDWLRDAFGSPE